MTDREKLMSVGCEFCEHSAGYHACRYTANHPDNKRCPNICVNGSHFALNPNIDKSVVDNFLRQFDVEVHYG